MPANIHAHSYGSTSQRKAKDEALKRKKSFANVYFNLMISALELSLNTLIIQRW